MDLRAYREKRGWTLEDVAKFVGVKGSAAVSKHESGMRMPRPAVLEQYVKLTNGEVGYSDFLAARKRFSRKQKAERNPAPA